MRKIWVGKRTTTEKPCAYLTGPMTGYENFNFGAFHKAKEILEERGYDVISPADFGEEGTWQENLRRDIWWIVDQVDVLFTLPNWFESRGATLEIFVATQVGIPVERFTPISALPNGKKEEVTV